MSAFSDLAEKIRAIEGETTMTVRELLRFFGQERRGKHVTADVRWRLRNERLETVPNFEVVHIDTPIVLRAKPLLKGKEAKQEDAKLAAEPNMAENREVVLTIGQLEEAGRAPHRVSRHDSVSKAVTLLMNHGVTHLAVMNGERTVDGVIGWQTIGKARAAKKPSDTVEHYMSQVRIVEVDTPLFEAVRDIIESEVVLVRAKDKKISGMVTAQDIAKQFVTLSEPFLFLEQIENHLRAILETAKLSHDVVQSLVNPADTERKEKVKCVDDLSFGETARAFANEEIWGRLHLTLDSSVFCQRLEEIRSIRNKVMHFHPDGISPDDREVLRKTRQMLQSL